MTITVENIGKKYGKNWIFRGVNAEIASGKQVVITGPNGSGKSTLLQIIAGYLTPSEGLIFHDGQKPEEKSFGPICFSAPYQELPEELTFREFLDFHSHFRKRIYSNREIADRAFLPLDQSISEFSTGMKQRVQLSTQFYFKNDLTCMDEPTANLDLEGYEWWKKELRLLEGTLLLASNQDREIELFEDGIKLSSDKHANN